MPPLRAVFLAVAGALTLFAGCGHTQVVGPNRTLGLGITEYRLDPQSVRVSPGSLTIVIHNYGRLTHNLVLLSHGQKMAATQPIPPGQSVEESVVLTKGNYTMTSTIMSDQALGTYGTLTVT